MARESGRGWGRNAGCEQPAWGFAITQHHRAHPGTLPEKGLDPVIQVEPVTKSKDRTPLKEDLSKTDNGQQ